MGNIIKNVNLRKCTYWEVGNHRAGRIQIRNQKRRIRGLMGPSGCGSLALWIYRFLDHPMGEYFFLRSESASSRGANDLPKKGNMALYSIFNLSWIDCYLKKRGAYRLSVFERSLRWSRKQNGRSARSNEFMPVRNISSAAFPVDSSSELQLPEASWLTSVILADEPTR